MKKSCAGIILAGGKNTRLPGKNKALVNIGKKRNIDYILDTFHQYFKEIIIVTNEPEKFTDIDAYIVSDLFNYRSSLTGLHTGLFYTTCPYAFFSACDNPFLKNEMIELVLNDINENIDVVVPKITEGYEPLCAVYSKRCIQAVENNINQKKFQIKQFFKKIKTKTINEKTLRKIDPDLISFFNVNTPEDLEKARHILINGEF